MFLGRLGTLVAAFKVHFRKNLSSKKKKSPDIKEAIEKVGEVLLYKQDCTKRVRRLQHLKVNSITNGPEGTVSNKCLRSLELLKSSLISLDRNSTELSSMPGYQLKVNVESFLMLEVE